MAQSLLAAFVEQGRRCDVEAQFAGARDLVDVLAAGAGTAHVGERVFALGNHAQSWPSTDGSIGDRRARRKRGGGLAALEDADLALRRRNADAVLAEQGPDAPVHVGAHVVDALGGIADPEAQLDLHAVVGELEQARDGRRVAQDPRVIGGLLQERERELDVIVVGDAHGQPQPHARMAVAPVDERIRDHVLVRDERRDAVAVADHDVAPAQLLDPAETGRAGAGRAGETDHVAGLDRAVDQEHEAADEVRRDRLQPETEPEADGAGEDSERREVDARGLQARTARRMRSGKRRRTCRCRCASRVRVP